MRALLRSLGIALMATSIFLTGATITGAVISAPQTHSWMWLLPFTGIALLLVSLDTRVDEAHAKLSASRTWRERIARHSRNILLAAAAAAALATPAQAQARQSSAYTVDNSCAVARSRTEPRIDTRYIILHQTQGDFAGARARITRGQLAHYIVKKDGTVCPAVPDDRYANHAGRSMRDGIRDISRHSVGIEIEGAFPGKPTRAQNNTLRTLISQLQRKYNVPDERVLGHYEVACCRKNRYSPGNERGGRYDAVNIDWDAIGVRHTDYDPDVAAGRIRMNPQHRQVLRENGIDTELTPRRASAPRQARTGPAWNVITANRTPYGIAGDDYNAASTIYAFPNGTIRPGSAIRNWDAIPANTKVFVGSTMEAVRNTLMPAVTVERGETLWSKVGPLYDDEATIYVQPDNKIVRGSELSTSSVPPGTRIIPYVEKIAEFKRGQNAYHLAGEDYNTRNVYYLTPSGALTRGDSIRDFTRFDVGTRVLIKKR